MPIATGLPLRVRFTDEGRIFTITVRLGIAEVVEGEPLPGTPDPIATIVTDGPTWKRLAVQALNPVEAVATGSLAIEGDTLAALAFTKRFRKGL